jgi:hypothetical protein
MAVLELLLHRCLHACVEGVCSILHPVLSRHPLVNNQARRFHAWVVTGHDAHNVVHCVGPRCLANEGADLPASLAMYEHGGSGMVLVPGEGTTKKKDWGERKRERKREQSLEAQHFTCVPHTCLHSNPIGGRQGGGLRAFFPCTGKTGLSQIHPTNGKEESPIPIGIIWEDLSQIKQIKERLSQTWEMNTYPRSGIV